MTLIALFLVTCFLAYSNGANDNFKGVATLFGSGTTSYGRAIWWATITTFAGSVSSIFLAQTLVKNFSGKGLVPDAVIASPVFLLAVALGAGLTVMLATVTGFPISTTHGLTGALVGSGLVAVGTQVNFAKLGSSFLLPLLVSPLIAVGLGVMVYLAARFIRMRMGVTKEWCLCVGETEQLIPISEPSSVLSFSRIPLPDVKLATRENCTQRYQGRVVGIGAQQALDAAHFISAGSMSFARGLNDTPKIVALLLVIEGLGIQWGMLAVAAGMAIGGLINARKVAITMSQKITRLNHGQGFTSNLVTALLVIFASRLGLPVSTTHVSVGSLFGIGLVTRQADLRVVLGIVLSWVLTLPIAALLSGGSYWLLKTL
ncbi:MAG TPA: inorganic phosphate transporter [Blastocatellia bacterium]|nr:inorganic phosphate transporter [Blastocatellia bacterium]